ncbi:hypothetical protein [Pseudoalteromonas sp. R3]|uniref:hypothetical protein n=1 Tax=Pseudoalteromonas sp. R3 TaxID=1709477 RepID=UPI0006B5BA3A|nr:hypothetical protein [Pseudoalteromonas sp. R3]AZZ97988.1 hypothetical protein ELR70_13215 [Pseudoalteromonas sp. R3]
MTIGTKNPLQMICGNAILDPIALDKQSTPCRWIRHPQAVRQNENLTYHIPPYQRNNTLIHALLRWLWGHGSGAKENAPSVSFVLGHCLAATRSTINIQLFMGIQNVIYTFLVASGNQTLSKLSRIRTVSAVADTEAQARAQLTGLPLVFVSRNTAKAGAL